MGRQSTFNEKDAAEIIGRLSKGEPLAAICRDEWLPAIRTVYDWKDANAEFAADFVRAREAGFDAIAVDCLRIADGKSSPEERAQAEVDYASTGKTPLPSDAQRDRIRVETRLKLLAKWDPKRYGDKVALVGGGGGDAPVKFERIERIVVRPPDTDR